MQRHAQVIVLLALFMLPQAPSIVRAETHHVLRFLRPGGSPHRLHTMRFSPDGTILTVSVSGDRVSFVRTRDGEIVRSFKDTPFSLGYSQDGTRLFMISKSKRTLLDTRSGTTIAFDYNARASPGHLGISCEVREGKILVKAIDTGGPVQVMDAIHTGDEITGVGEGRGGQLTRVLGYSLDRLDKLLQGDAGSFVRLYVIPKGEAEPAIHTVRRRAAERQGDRLVFIPSTNAMPQEQVVWCTADHGHEFSDARTGEIISVFNPIDLQDDGQVAISPDGKLFAILARQRDRNADGIEIFNITTRERLLYAPFPGDSRYQIRFSADGKQLLIGTDDTVEILDIKTGKYAKALTLSRNPSPQKPRAAGTDRSIKLPVFKSTRIILPRRDNFYQLLHCFAVSSQNVVATGNPFGTVRIWDLSTGEKLREFATNYNDEVEAIEFSRDGKSLAFYVQGELHVVDTSGLRSQVSREPKNNRANANHTGNVSAPLPNSKVFQSSNGGEIRITFERPVTDAEFQQALSEVLDKLKEQE